MSGTPTFRNWLIAQRGGCTAFQELVRRTGADGSTGELGDALSQWQLHFAGQGVSGEVREALRAAWWRYIDSRALPGASRSPVERVVRSLERSLAQLAEPAVAWMREPRAGTATRAARVERKTGLMAQRGS